MKYFQQMKQLREKVIEISADENLEINVLIEVTTLNESLSAIVKIVCLICIITGDIVDKSLVF